MKRLTKHQLVYRAIVESARGFMIVSPETKPVDHRHSRRGSGSSAVAIGSDCSNARNGDTSSRQVVDRSAPAAKVDRSSFKRARLEAVGKSLPVVEGIIVLNGDTWPANTKPISADIVDSTDDGSNIAESGEHAGRRQTRLRNRLYRLCKNCCVCRRKLTLQGRTTDLPQLVVDRLACVGCIDAAIEQLIREESVFGGAA